MTAHWILRNKSMEQSPCWEADSRNSWSSTEFNRILWNPKGLLHVHGRMWLVLILRQIKPVRSLQSYFCMIHFIIVLLSTPVLQADYFLQVPSPKYMHISSPHFVSKSKSKKLIFNKIWAVSVRSKAWSLRPLACWGHGSMSLVNVVRFQVEVSATGRSLVQRSSTECMPLSAIRCNNNSLNCRYYFGLRRTE
jgi:hypothetical protein